MRRLRRNPEFLYDPEKLSRWSGQTHPIAPDRARPEYFNYEGEERGRLGKAHEKWSRELHSRHLREVDAILKKRGLLSAATASAGEGSPRKFIPSYILGTPEHLRPREGEKYRSPFNHTFRVKSGTGSPAEWAKIFKKFPSSMTYSILPDYGEQSVKGEQYSPSEVHSRARAVGGRLRTRAVDYTGMAARNAEHGKRLGIEQEGAYIKRMEERARAERAARRQARQATLTAARAARALDAAAAAKVSAPAAAKPWTVYQRREVSRALSPRGKKFKKRSRAFRNLEERILRMSNPSRAAWRSFSGRQGLTRQEKSRLNKASWKRLQAK